MLESVIARADPSWPEPGSQGWRVRRRQWLKNRRRRRPPADRRAYRERFTCWCRRFAILGPPELCRDRRRALDPYHYCHTCRGRELRPATAAEIAAHWEMVDRLAAAQGETR